VLGLGLVGLGWLPLVAFAAQLMLMCSKVFSAICFVAVRAIVTSGLNQFHAGKAPRALQPRMVSSTLCLLPAAFCLPPSPGESTSRRRASWWPSARNCLNAHDVHFLDSPNGECRQRAVISGGMELNLRLH